MLPFILAEQLQKGIEVYIETTFSMTNEPFKGLVQGFKNLDDILLVSGLMESLPFDFYIKAAEAHLSNLIPCPVTI